MPILARILSHYLTMPPSPTASDSLSLPHTHTLTITCTGCYDEIKATQDLKIYSHADAQILSHCITAHSLCDAFCCRWDCASRDCAGSPATCSGVKLTGCERASKLGMAMRCCGLACELSQLEHGWVQCEVLGVSYHCVIECIVCTE